MVTINSAESNRASLRFIKETVWGETPTSGNTYEMRITSSGLEASKETEVSEEIRADRMVPSIIEVSAMSGGPTEHEFAAGTADPFLEAFLLGAWTTPMNFFQVKGASVSVTDTDEITLAGADYTDYLTVGQHIKLEGFLTTANNDYFEIDSVSFSGGNTVVVVTETVLTAEAGSAFTKFLDAGDVLVKSSAITFTSGNTIDGGATAAFGGVKVGQKIWIETSLGKGTATVTVNATDPTEGSTITLSDGVETYIFEIRTNLALVAEGNIGVALSGTEATQAASIAAAINGLFRQQKWKLSATVSTAVVTVTNHLRTGGTVATSDATAFTVAAFTGGSASKGGLYTVLSVPDNDTIVTSETLTADANSGTVNVVVKGSHVRNPGEVSEITKQSFSIETGFTDIAKYFLMDGMRCGTFNMSAEAGSIVTMGFEFMGRRTVRSSTATLTGGGYNVLAAAGTEVLNATSNVGNVKKDGSNLASAIMSIEIEGEAGLREQYAIGEKFPAGIGYGRFSLSGSLTAYFDSFDLYDDFINHVTTSLSLDFADADSNTYVFTIPALKITSDPIVPDGIDQDVMEEMEWTAQRDPILNTQFMVDRLSSVWPVTGV